MERRKATSIKRFRRNRAAVTQAHFEGLGHFPTSKKCSPRPEAEVSIFSHVYVHMPCLPVVKRAKMGRFTEPRTRSGTDRFRRK